MRRLPNRKTRARDAGTLCADAPRKPGAARRGFSLVELLVVISIIVLLVTILLPSIRRSIRQARSTVCKSNLKEVYVALDIYRTDNQGWLPTVGAVDAFRQVETWWAKLVDTTPGVRNILICPDDPLATLLRTQIAQRRFGDNGPGSYGLNDFIVSSPRAFLSNLDRHSPARPADTILVADLGPDVIATPEGSDGIVRGPTRNFGRLSMDDLYQPGNLPEDQEASWLTGRHVGSINLLSVVGNVRDIPTRATMDRSLVSYYPACAAGDCTICRYLDLPHYSFAEQNAYWWTGPAPRP
jgi:prepilin-type N-terminal cleavage/methylation domain-containing protein